MYEILVTPMDGSLVIMEGSLLSRFFILQWIVALSLWKVVSCGHFGYSNDGTLVIMEGSIFPRFFLLHCMVALTLWKVVCCRYFFNLMDGSLVIVEGSLLS